MGTGWDQCDQDELFKCQELEALVLSEGQGAKQGRSDRLEGS